MVSASATVHPTAYVGPNVEVGDGAYVGPFCALGLMAEHPRERTEPKGLVKIGAGAVLTKLVTVDAPMEGVTEVGEKAYLMAHSHVGHDAKLGEGTILACGAKIGGHSTLGKYCNIGLNAVVHQHSALLDGCMVGASGFFKGHTLLPFSIYAGVPAKYIKQNEVLIKRLKDAGIIDDSHLFTGG